VTRLLGLGLAVADLTNWTLCFQIVLESTIQRQARCLEVVKTMGGALRQQLIVFLLACERAFYR